MAKKQRRKKNSSVMIVLVTLGSLTIMTLLLVLCAAFAGASNNNRKHNDYVESDVVNAIATEKVTVKINMENCTMKVGTKMQVTATLYPTGSSSGIMWTSSDESVFTVDAKGNLEVIGTGIVSLTANFGDAYDSIAIECVEAEDKAVLNLPDYSMFTNNSGNNKETEKATIPLVETATGKKPVETSSTDSTTTAKQPTTTAKQTETTAKKPTAAQTTPAETTKKEAETTTLYTLEPTTKYDKTIVLSTEIAGRLPDYGFKKYLDNTYVYEDNGAYLGEIIITSNMTHIYIKERSAGFDTAVSGVLTELLPDSHDNIWNIYSGAVTDQTLTVDGRVVRVVVSGNGGHSQIVIYN